MAKNQFLSPEWARDHFRWIENRAGKRYTPELHVDLPIIDICNGLSRTKEFYSLIRKHNGRLKQAFQDIKQTYDKEEVQQTFEILKQGASQLSALLDQIREYNTRRLPWSQIDEQAIKVAKSLDEFFRENRKDSGSRASYPYRIQEEIDFFQKFLSDDAAQLSNRPLCLLHGPAGVGKTHLLCKAAQDRLAGEIVLPTIMTFGEYFQSHEDPFIQIIKQFKLNMDKDQFIKSFDNSGKQTGCRAIIIIDALNETRERNFWKKKLNIFINEIRKYKNVALLVSIREGFQEETIPKKLLENFFIKVEHQGFKFKEWEAIQIFFKKFNLPLPEAPLLAPVFQNPLFLQLFCEAYEYRMTHQKGNKRKQILRGHEGGTYIFETFVDSASEKILKKFSIRWDRSIWDDLFKKIAEQMVKERSSHISEEKFISLVESTYPSVEPENFIKELEENLLIHRLPMHSSDDASCFRFTFERFSNHLIGRYIFKEYEKEFGKSNKNLKTAKKFFSRRRKIGRFLAESFDQGLVESLSVQCPEYIDGVEFMEVAPYIDHYCLQGAFIESLIWRNPKDFSENIHHALDYICEIMEDDYDYDEIIENDYDEIMKALLTVAYIPNHPFNAEFLHKHLLELSMPRRDASWSAFLHKQYYVEEKRTVAGLLQWSFSMRSASSFGHKADGNKTVFLYSIILSWFLTTSNRFVRDQATKALVALLTNRLDLVLRLLQKFRDVDDPYVSERLYAVAYGCALRSITDRDGLKRLAEWIYKEIFQSGNPPAHILLRDYARGVIETAFKNKIRFPMQWKKIIPPFNSKPPHGILSDKSLKKRYNLEEYHRKYPLLNWKGDFRVYVLNSAIHCWSEKRLNEKEVESKNIKCFDSEKASRWILQRVMQLGWTEDLHGVFDQRVIRHDRGREAYKPERIGKKYQWIAFHELLARIADNFRYAKKEYRDVIENYSGPWQDSLSIRDIDPSCIINKYQSELPKDMTVFDKNKIYPKYGSWNEDLSESEWLQNQQDLPTPERIIEIFDTQGDAWIALGGLGRWRQDILPENINYRYPVRTLRYHIRSYVFKEESKSTALQYLINKYFTDHETLEFPRFHEIYLGEYPWALAFDYHNIEYDEMSVKCLLTNNEYFQEKGTFDCSIDRNIQIYLPAKFIVEGMKLVQSDVDGRFFDREGNLIVFDSGVFFHNDLQQYVFIRKDKFLSFLKQKGYVLYWLLQGRKYILQKEGGIGELRINGLYVLDDKNNIVVSKTCPFEKYPS